jgi:lipopolysaccharide export system protein LptA
VNHPIIQVRRMTLAVAAIMALLLTVVTQSGAQSDRQAPGLFKTQPQKRDEPVKITALKLEVRDKDKMATFTGNVHIIQGETDVRCNVLDVFYEEQKGASAPKAAAATPGDRGSQQIRRMEGRGSVIVTQKDMRAVGDRANYDVPNNTITLTGKVVVTRGEDVLRGQRLIIYLTTGIVEVDSSGGPVEMLINPKSQPKSGK